MGSRHRSPKARRFSPAEKAAILAELDGGGAQVRHVAARHGTTVKTLYVWLRERRLQSNETDLFGATPSPRQQASAGTGDAVEIKYREITLSVSGSQDPSLISALLKAIREHTEAPDRSR